MGNRAPLESGVSNSPCKSKHELGKGVWFNPWYTARSRCGIITCLPAAIQASNLKEQNQSSIALENTFRFIVMITVMVHTRYEQVNIIYVFHKTATWITGYPIKILDKNF